MGRMKSLLGVLLAALLLVAGAGMAGAAPKMVIDRSHGQTADLRGFSSVLVSKGWEVVDQSVPLTAEVLNACNLLVVTQPVSDFTEAEAALVRSYVESGGGLWVLYDLAEPYDAYGPLPPNMIPSAFGASFSAAAVVDYEEPYYTYTPRIPIPAAFTTDPAFADYAPLFAGVTSFVYLDGVYLKDKDGVSPLQAGSDFPVVLTTKNASGFSDDFLDWGPLPVFAAGKVGQGKVVFIGDATPLASAEYAGLEPGNKQLVDNILAWAMKLEPVPPEQPTTIEVPINLRPWNPHNTINLDWRGFIRVAIMSDSTFAAADVNPKSVKFAGGSPVCSKLMNVNRDRHKDLVLVFWIPDLKDLTCDSTEAVLTGKTKDGKSIQGSDSVQIVPSKKCKKPADKGKDCGGKKGK